MRPDNKKTAMAVDMMGKGGMGGYFQFPFHFPLRGPVCWASSVWPLSPSCPSTIFLLHQLAQLPQIVRCQASAKSATSSISLIIFFHTFPPFAHGASTQLNALQHSSIPPNPPSIQQASTFLVSSFTFPIFIQPS